jgi:phosphate starvation-inducible PhoH-like protein
LSTEEQVHVLTLEPNDSRRLAVLCGPFDQNLRQIEDRLGIRIRNRANAFHLSGDDSLVQLAEAVISHLYEETHTSAGLSPDHIHLLLQQSGVEALLDKSSDAENLPLVRTRRRVVKPRGPNQVRYVRALQTYDVNFGIGPAGTGKTYLAVAAAVQALEAERVTRMLLVRPAVEAGEKLGFLPGDLAQKIDPYLRPLYDALYELMGFEKVHKLIERQVIEIAPLAYMRGRTLNNAFIILDEGQNTTVEQMKMFLTRLGFGSTAVITGDITQIDLPRGTRSGLIHVMEVLRQVEGISFTRFGSKDVVRHPLVQSIVEAYDRHDGNPSDEQLRDGRDSDGDD